MRLLYLGPPETIDEVRANLGTSFDVQLALDGSAVDQLLPGSDVVLDASMRVHFPSQRIAKAWKLKLFVTATTGSDHIDAAQLAERGIPLLTLSGEREFMRNITPAAEHSWLLLLACARGLRSAVGGVLAGQWERNKYPGLMLRGKTLGLIGCGRIGQWMSRYALAFGMKCLGYDPYVDPWPESITRVDLPVLLKTADFVSLHVPLSEQTRRIIGETELALMKPSAILINTSRGDVIDETQLLVALQEGRIAAAGLDVLSGEPEIASHPLVEYARTHQNLIITPHIAGFSPEALRLVLAFSCGRIVKFFGV